MESSFANETLNFHNNLINFLILFVLLGVLWKRTMPAVLNARQHKVTEALNEAQRAKQEAQNFIETQKQRMASAEREAEQILVEARQVAEQMKKSIADQTKLDGADLERKLTQQIETQRQMVITELRSQAAIGAVRLAEASLPGAITANVKSGLQERFINQLDTIGNVK
jgi:F-type H+-transporting ATPase subunit b